MAGGENDAAERLALTDYRGCRRCREKPPTPDQQVTEAARSRHFDDGLDGAVVVEAAVAADDQGFSLKAVEAVEDGLHEIFEIVGLLEDGDLLSEA